MKGSKITFILRGIFVGLFIIVCSNAVNAQEGNLTPEMVVNLKSASQAVLDPSGKNIAYVLRVPRSDGDPLGSSYSEIWVVPVDGGEQRQYTSKPVNSNAPSWSPDGKNITFLSRRTSYNPLTQIYSIPLDGGEAKILTHHQNSVRSYRWSPDGNMIAFISSDPESDEQKKAKKSGRDWKVFDENLKHRRLWVMNVATGESNKLYDAELSTWSFAWSPDSKTIAFQTTDTPLIDNSYMFRKIHTIPSTGGMPKVLCKTEGKLGNMAFSPDGSQLAFLGAVSLNDPLSQSLFVVSSSGGDAKNLTEDYEGSGNWVGWADNRTLLLLATEGSHNILNRVNAKTGKQSQVIGKGPILQSIDLQLKTGRFAAIGNTPEHPSEVFTGTLKKGELSRLSNHNPNLKTIQLAPQEVVEWKGADDWRIEGILTYPLDYKAGQRYPLILQIHGGPEGVSLNGWTTRPTYPVQVLAANGYMVLQPNYRGSAGRGVAFSKADHDDLGGKEFEDVLAGVDALIERGLVESKQVGTGGWSYGGYFSAWGATRHSERFKASVVSAGLTNWMSFTGTTDIPYEMSIVHWNSWWYDKPQLHWDRSPIAHINKAQTPTLVVHGESDVRVHPEQGLELYTALKLKGVATQLVFYPRQPHGLIERAHELDYIQRVLNWYDLYVKGKKTKQAIID